jgi:hypothetical protein
MSKKRTFSLPFIFFLLVVSAGLVWLADHAIRHKNDIVPPETQSAGQSSTSTTSSTAIPTATVMSIQPPNVEPSSQVGDGCEFTPPASRTSDQQPTVQDLQRQKRNSTKKSGPTPVIPK